MAGRLALDTNIIIALLDHEPDAISFVAGYEEVIVPGIALGELYFGAFRSARAQFNLDRVAQFIATRPVKPCDKDTSVVYGEIKTQLVNKGRPIPDNDIWISAIAIQCGAALATRDRHFESVEGLTVVAP